MVEMAIRITDCVWYWATGACVYGPHAHSRYPIRRWRKAALKASRHGVRMRGRTLRYQKAMLATGAAAQRYVEKMALECLVYGGSFRRVIKGEFIDE
jgi:hypothetical protein